jgi:hypothetical protein
VFSFGISENIVFSNVIDIYHLVDERYNKTFLASYAGFSIFYCLLYHTFLNDLRMLGEVHAHTTVSASPSML